MSNPTTREWYGRVRASYPDLLRIQTGCSQDAGAGRASDPLWCRLGEEPLPSVHVPAEQAKISTELPQLPPVEKGQRPTRKLSDGAATEQESNELIIRVTYKDKEVARSAAWGDEANDKSLETSIFLWETLERARACR